MIRPGMTGNAPATFKITATPDAAGRRTDRFLAEANGTLSRSRVKALMLDGGVSRDGQALRDPAEPVRPGAVYELHLPAPVAATPEPQAIPFPILHEDADLIVIDKPAGLVVHPAPGNEDGTLVNALLAHCGDSLPGIGGERRPGIVHRLDKDTSGVMVVAKTETALAALSAAFAARDLDRAYLALVWGPPAPPAGTIEGAIGRDPRDRKRMAVVAEDAGGKPARTEFVRLARFDSADLLRAHLHTGRTHQIRVHLASLGRPVLGDDTYGGGGGRRLVALPSPRHFLHAALLRFRHPGTGAEVEFRAPLPADLRQSLSAIAGDPALADDPDPLGRFGFYAGG